MPALQTILQKPMVKYLQAGEMDKALALMPNKMELAIKGTPICNITKAIDPIKVEAFVAFALTKEVAMMWNGDSRLNLQSHQIPIVARTLIMRYESESLADFTLCFRRGVMGYYNNDQDKLLRIDGSVIMSWMAKYMDEKYQIIEGDLMRQKDEFYKQVEPIKNSDRDYLQEWLDALKDDGMKGVIKLTEKEILQEGQDKPKAKPYVSTSLSEIRQRELHIQWIRENFDARTSEKLPGWMPENEWIENNK